LTLASLPHPTAPFLCLSHWNAVICKRTTSRAVIFAGMCSWNCSGGGTVDFQEFVGGLSAFSSRGGREEKLKCELLSVPCSHRQLTVTHVLVAFKVYDVDRDGFISNGELFLVLKMMVGNNLKVRVPSYQNGPSGQEVDFSTRLGPTTTADRGQDDHGGRS
jgi:hypothetical protein